MAPQSIVSAGAWLLATAAAVAALLSARGKKSIEPSSEPVAPRGFPIDSPRPGSNSRRINGGRESLNGLLALGRPLFLIFSNPKCGPLRCSVSRSWEMAASSSQGGDIVIVSEGSIKGQLC